MNNNYHKNLIEHSLSILESPGIPINNKNQELPETIEINGIKYKKVEEEKVDAAQKSGYYYDSSTNFAPPSL